MAKWNEKSYCTRGLSMSINKDNTLNMFIYYSKSSIKSWFQYKIDACMRSLAVFLREATGIIVIYLTLMTFDNINGWNPNELLFLFSLIFLTYGILIIFFTGLRDFESMVNSGGFDRLVLRPRGILFQVLASNSDWFAAIGHGGLGITLFIISINKIGVIWNLHTILYFLLVLIGGVLIQGAIFLIIASLSFYFIKSGNIREVFYWNMRKFAVYPISIFPKIVQYIMIYVVPLAFVNYFPAQFLLMKADMVQYPEMFLYITPIIGIMMYLLAYLFWRISLRCYKSSGN